MTPSQSKEIAVLDEPGALSLADDEWGDVASGFVGEAPPQAAKPVVPRFTFNAKTGQGFIDELTETKIGIGETLRCVVLLWSEKRAYWADDFGKGDKSPTCRSSNMLVPDELSIEKQSPACATCPHSEWNDNQPPECGVRVDVMLYLPDTQRVVRTSFGGLALKHLTRYLGGFMTRLPQRPPMAFITEITVDSQETPNGEFLVPKFKIAGDITRAEAAPLIALREELRKQWEALAAEDLNTSHDDSGKGADPFASTNADKIKDAFGGDVIDVEEEPF